VVVSRKTRDVIDRFYKRLWDFRIGLAESIQSPISEHEKIMAAQRLLDRLIFLYFLAEKGIIIVLDRNKECVQLSAKELFNCLMRESKDFHDTLNSICFEYLENPKKNQMRISKPQGLFLRVPYLNGMLFDDKALSSDRGEVRESDLRIKGFEWDRLLDEFSRYNWVIQNRKSEKSQKAVGNLTPEVLGYIYEMFVISVSKSGEIEKLDDLKTTSKGELRKGNKRIGGYYTSERIARYIVENTVFPYAAQQVGIEAYGSFDEFIAADHGESGSRLLSAFNEELRNIKILDPAAGSGHFLIAAADILLDWRTTCDDNQSEYEIKREIIVNNLFGVDIMEGAVEICKLRLWLWLIASEQNPSNPETLPNLDFNIRAGNSLVGFAEKEIDVETQSRDLLEDLSDDLSLYAKNIRKFRLDSQGTIQEKKRIEDPKQKMKKKFNRLYLRASKRKLEREFQNISEALRFLTKNNDSESELTLKLKEHMTDETRDKLEALGFRTWKITAKCQPNVNRTDSEHLDRLVEFIHGNDNIERIIATREPISEDLEKTKPFHWVLEFPSIFRDRVGFDVVIGNPPYGALTRSEEKTFIADFYRTGKYREIAAHFIERQVECLLREDGYFGNITTNSILANSTMHELHNVIRENLRNTYTSAFARRPSKMFRNAEINVAITIGQKSANGNGTWKTSDFIRFREEEREKLMETIEYGSIDGLILRNRIGGEQDAERFEVIPKVGDQMKESILRKLAVTNRRIGGCTATRGYKLYYRNAANYWMNVCREKAPKATNMELVCFENELERDTAFLALNSSLFYLYWMTYGDMHHVTKSQIMRFPMPDVAVIEEHADGIETFTYKLSRAIKEHYHPHDYHQFRMEPLKPLIDRIEEELIGRVYDLEGDQIAYLQSYHNEYGR
jgi:type I restriction-modification system DNA methylase subunit